MLEERLEKELKEENGSTEFVSDVIDQMWLMPSAKDASDLYDKLTTWINHYRYENNCSENLVFPSVETMEGWNV